MPEKKTLVRVFMIDYMCDECGEGRMIPEKIVLTTNPPKYPHKCEKCGAKRNFGMRYPRQALEPMEQSD